MYGSSSLYVGAVLHDEDPGAIEQALGRRDDYDRADWFLVSIDWEYGRRTAYTFGVNAPACSSMRSTRVGAAAGIGTLSGAPASLEPGDYTAFDDGGLLDGILGGVAPFDADRYLVTVFGGRDTRSLDLSLRSTVTFTPTLSFQLYSQLFLARGRYNAFRILQNRDELAAFDPFPKRQEFAFSSLQSNAVLRWEYRPGSTLALVWTHGRRADDELNPLAPWGPSPYDQRLNQQIAETWKLIPDDVFLIKLNYTFLY